MGACATKPAVLKDAEIDGAPAPEVKGEEAAPAPAVVELVKEVVVIEEDVISINVADASIDIKPRSLSNLFEEGEVIKQATGDHELPIAGEPISVEPEIKEEKADQKLVDEKPVEEKLIKTETKQDIEKPNVNIVVASTIIEETTKEKEPVVVSKEKDIAVEEKPKTETKTNEKVVVVVQTAEKVIEKLVEPVPKITNKEKEPVVTAEVKTVIPVEEKPKSETLKSVDTKSPAAAVEVKQEITEKTGTSQQKTEVKPATVVMANEKK